MRYIIPLLLIISFSCNQEVTTNELSLNEIFSSKYEHSLISRGDNFPDFRSRKDSIDLFLVSLHHKIDVKSFQKKAGWTDSLTQNKIDLLTSKNWLHNKDDLRPTVFIASNAEGLKLMELAKPISEMIAKSVEEEILNTIKLYVTTELSKIQPFSTMSFLILSNVLLDNWQINNVERDFLQKDNRPERHGKHYYYSIIQNPNYPKEKFGIYGNKFGKINDTISYSVYGNNRITFAKRLRSDSAFKDSILHNAPVVSAKDNIAFRKMADAYLPKLLSILNDNREYMNKVYYETGYADEITFEEFFIWWYHLIYTDATNILASKGHLEIPKSGNFPYIRK
ncbi:MAG: hypothetical protein ACRBF0_09425 [Calditrichia bacterium]